jgi:carbonic anhydrase
MPKAGPLPDHLIARYRDWREGTHAANLSYYEELASKGQHPQEMIISCCDSRVHVTSIFGATSGELFIHRNIAGLVPPCEPAGDRHGTSAAVEYAVAFLGINHLIVMGHSNCGGVAGCYAMCSGTAPELEKRGSFVGGWMEILRPGYDRLAPEANEAARMTQLEKEAVIVSLENLMTFPFVAERVASGDLALHGLYTDIAAGSLDVYDPETHAFIPV